MFANLVTVVAAFWLGVGIAELFAAVNMGTALGLGSITFSLALVYVLLRR